MWKTSSVSDLELSMTETCENDLDGLGAGVGPSLDLDNDLAVLGVGVGLWLGVDDTMTEVLVGFETCLSKDSLSNDAD